MWLEAGFLANTVASFMVFSIAILAVLSAKKAVPMMKSFATILFLTQIDNKMVSPRVTAAFAATLKQYREEWTKEKKGPTFKRKNRYRMLFDQPVLDDEADPNEIIAQRKWFKYVNIAIGSFMGI